MQSISISTRTYEDLELMSVILNKPINIHTVVDANYWSIIEELPREPSCLRRLKRKNPRRKGLLKPRQKDKG